MKKIIIFLFVFLSHKTFPQRKYSKELSIISDNDLYTSLSKDRYYTNGLFFSYRFLSNKTYDNNQKKIYEILIGQQIYTPFKAVVQSKLLHDRPFAGYLYGSFGLHYFFANSTVLKFSTQIGTVGPSSLSEEVMKITHKIYGFKEAIGWKHQIKETFGFNINANFIKPISLNTFKKADISWYNDIKIGTIFSDISSGLYARLSFNPLQNLNNSVAFNGNLNNTKSKTFNKPEFFIYAKPIISYVIHDTTIQGSFFNNNSPVTYNIIPFKFSTEIGLHFTANRFNFAYTVNYHTKKLKSVQVPSSNIYGSIKINYQLN